MTYDQFDMRRRNLSLVSKYIKVIKKTTARIKDIPITNILSENNGSAIESIESKMIKPSMHIPMMLFRLRNSAHL